jgi:hypothetical protein
MGCAQRQQPRVDQHQLLLALNIILGSKHQALRTPAVAQHSNSGGMRCLTHMNVVEGSS